MAAGQGLDKATMLAQLATMFEELAVMTDPETAKQKFATDIADIIETYVKSGKVVTMGSATNQTGLIT